MDKAVSPSASSLILTHPLEQNGTDKNLLKAHVHLSHNIMEHHYKPFFLFITLTTLICLNPVLTDYMYILRNHKQYVSLIQIEEYETHQELWRESINNLSDQFEFLWQEIQAEEKQCKRMKKEEEEDEEELGEEEEQLLEELETSVSYGVDS